MQMDANDEKERIQISLNRNNRRGKLVKCFQDIPHWKFDSSCGTMELDSNMSMALQPAFERHDTQCPAASQTSDGDGNVHEHHHVIMSPSHGSDGDFLC